MSQLPRETDEMENPKEREVCVLENCVILNIENYDKLKKYETQFKVLTEKQREGEVDFMLDHIKIANLDENACRLALKNGIVLDDFVQEYKKNEWQSLADKYLAPIDELKAQAYEIAMRSIHTMLRIKEYQRTKGNEQQ